MFNWSPAADIFRSLQKDEYHLSHWRSEWSELTSSLLGSHATRYEPEVDLLARGTYYGCTSLLGRSTLGEEYCDLMQVMARENRAEEATAAVAPTRREKKAQRRLRTDGERANMTSPAPPPPTPNNEASLTAPPSATVDQPPSSSLSSSSSSSSSTLIVPSIPSPTTHDSAVSSSSSSLSVSSIPSAPFPPHPSSFASPTYSWGSYTPFQLVSLPRRVALFTLQVLLPYAYDKAQQHARRLLFQVPPEEEEFGGHRLVEVEEDRWQTLCNRWKRWWNKGIQLLLRSDYTFFNSGIRLHLALFYLFGRYLEISKRIAGIQYIQMRSFDVPRPGYQLFGILLFIQVSVSLFQVLRTHIQSVLLSSHPSSQSALDGGVMVGHELPPLPGLHAPSIVPSEVGASGLMTLTEEERAERESSGGDGRTQIRPSTYWHGHGHGHRLNEEEKQEDDEEEEETDDEDLPTCTLCLCTRENTTATECGHLYCKFPQSRQR